MRNGVISGAASVETVVIPTENATSPLHRKLMMFEDTPPGQHPTSISPTPTSRGRPSTRTSVHAMSGMKVNCASAPTTMSSGRDARMRKSSLLSVIPIVSMITPRTAVCVYPRTHPNTPGAKYVPTATAAMKIGVHFASHAETA